MRKKLKSQKKREDKLRQENQRREEEIQEAENKYYNVQEEVDELRKINKKFRQRLKNAMAEIRDLTQEHEVEKEDLLETIREQERDAKMNAAIISIMLSPAEVEKIKGQATWNESRNEYKIPPFILKERKLKFPKLPMGQAMELVENEKSNRDFEWIQKAKVSHEHKNEEEELMDDDEEEEEIDESQLENRETLHREKKDKYNVPTQSVIKANFMVRGNSIRNYEYGMMPEKKPTPKRNVNLQLDPLMNNKPAFPASLPIHHSPNPGGDLNNKKAKRLHSII